MGQRFVDLLVGLVYHPVLEDTPAFVVPQADEVHIARYCFPVYFYNALEHFGKISKVVDVVGFIRSWKELFALLNSVEDFYASFDNFIRKCSEIF